MGGIDGINSVSSVIEGGLLEIVCVLGELKEIPSPHLLPPFLSLSAESPTINLPPK